MPAYDAMPDRSYNVQDVVEPRDGYIAITCYHLDAIPHAAWLTDSRDAPGIHILGWTCPVCGSRWEVARTITEHIGGNAYQTKWVAGRVKKPGSLAVGAIGPIDAYLQPIIDWNVDIGESA